MTADVFFPFAEFYAAPSGQRLRVKVGERFRVVVNDAPAFVFATTKDAVFAVTEFDANTIDVEALEQGMSEIQVQVNRTVPFYLNLEVYSQEAASLNARAGDPELK